MKLGLMGCGNMGEAILNGIMKSGVLSAKDVLLYDMDVKKTSRISEKYGTAAAKSGSELVENSGIVLLAVKPQDMTGLLESLSGELNGAGKLIVTIAAGLKVSLYRKTIKENPIARVMPNLPMLIGGGASAVYFDGKFSDEEKKLVLGLIQSCGVAEVVKKEEWLDAVTGLSGSGPAYVFLFINSLAEGGVKEGLPKDVALRLALQTVAGSAALLTNGLAEGKHPEKMKDDVTSPGGTTAAGLYALEKGRFRYTVMSAVKEAAKRSRELGGK